MRRLYGTTILADVLLATPVFGQDGVNRDEVPILLRQHEIPRTFVPTFRATPGIKSAQEWRVAIDSTWGAGLPTIEKLEIFDIFWQTIDEHFAAFQGLDIDWDTLRTHYRTPPTPSFSRRCVR